MTVQPKFSMESFIIKPQTAAISVKPRSIRNKQSSPRSKKEISSSQPKPLAICPAPQHIDLDNLPILFAHQTIYIDKKVCNPTHIHDIVTNMGAVVKPRLDHSVKVYIVGPTGPSQLKTKYTYQVTTTNWIYACIKDHCYYPPSHFPLELKPFKNSFSSQPAEEDDENPFGVESVDYDYLEEHRPGKQLNMDRYLIQQPQQGYEPIEATSTASTMGINDQEEQEQILAEISYNVGKKRPLSSQEKQERHRRGIEGQQAIFRKLELMKAEKEKQEAAKKQQQSKIVYPPTPEFVNDKLKIWYGEQKFYPPPTPKKLPGESKTTVSLMKRAKK